MQSSGSQNENNQNTQADYALASSALASTTSPSLTYSSSATSTTPTIPAFVSPSLSASSSATNTTSNLSSPSSIASNAAAKKVTSLNLNKAFKPAAKAAPIGVLTLGRGRAGKIVTKINAPKPVNLPSLKKENLGVDPISLVQGAGGWKNVSETNAAITSNTAATTAATSNSQQQQQQSTNTASPNLRASTSAPLANASAASSSTSNAWIAPSQRARTAANTNNQSNKLVEEFPSLSEATHQSTHVEVAKKEPSPSAAAAALQRSFAASSSSTSPSTTSPQSTTPATNQGSHDERQQSSLSTTASSASGNSNHAAASSANPKISLHRGVSSTSTSGIWASDDESEMDYSQPIVFADGTSMSREAAEKEKRGNGTASSPRTIGPQRDNVYTAPSRREAWNQNTGVNPNTSAIVNVVASGNNSNHTNSATISSPSQHVYPQQSQHHENEIHQDDFMKQRAAQRRVEREEQERRAAAEQEQRIKARLADIEKKIAEKKARGGIDVSNSSASSTSVTSSREEDDRLFSERRDRFDERSNSENERDFHAERLDREYRHDEYEPRPVIASTSSANAPAVHVNEKPAHVRHTIRQITSIMDDPAYEPRHVLQRPKDNHLASASVTTTSTTTAPTTANLSALSILSTGPSVPSSAPADVLKKQKPISVSLKLKSDDNAEKDATPANVHLIQSQPITATAARTWKDLSAATNAISPSSSTSINPTDHSLTNETISISPQTSPVIRSLYEPPKNKTATSSSSPSQDRRRDGSSSSTLFSGAQPQYSAVSASGIPMIAPGLPMPVLNVVASPAVASTTGAMSPSIKPVTGSAATPSKVLDDTIIAGASSTLLSSPGRLNTITNGNDQVATFAQNRTALLYAPIGPSSLYASSTPLDPASSLQSNAAARAIQPSSRLAPGTSPISPVPAAATSAAASTNSSASTDPLQQLVPVPAHIALLMKSYNKSLDSEFITVGQLNQLQAVHSAMQTRLGTTLTPTATGANSSSSSSSSSLSSLISSSASSSFVNWPETASAGATLSSTPLTTHAEVLASRTNAGIIDDSNNSTATSSSPSNQASILQSLAPQMAQLQQLQSQLSSITPLQLTHLTAPQLSVLQQLHNQYRQLQQYINQQMTQSTTSASNPSIALPAAAAAVTNKIPEHSIVSSPSSVNPIISAASSTSATLSGAIASSAASAVAAAAAAAATSAHHRAASTNTIRQLPSSSAAVSSAPATAVRPINWAARVTSQPNSTASSASVTNSHDVNSSSESNTTNNSDIIRITNPHLYAGSKDKDSSSASSAATSNNRGSHHQPHNSNHHTNAGNSTNPSSAASTNLMTSPSLTSATAQASAPLTSINIITPITPLAVNDKSKNEKRSSRSLRGGRGGRGGASRASQSNNNDEHANNAREAKVEASLSTASAAAVSTALTAAAAEENVMDSTSAATKDTSSRRGRGGSRGRGGRGRGGKNGAMEERKEPLADEASSSTTFTSSIKVPAAGSAPLNANEAAAAKPQRAPRPQRQPRKKKEESKSNTSSNNTSNQSTNSNPKASAPIIVAE